MKHLLAYGLVAVGLGLATPIAAQEAIRWSATRRAR